MGRVEKTISFRAEDAGVSSVVQKIRQTTEGLKNLILEDSLAMTKGTKDTIRVIEEEIKAIERRAKVQQAQEKMGIQGRFAGRIQQQRAGFEQFEEKYGRSVGAGGIEIQREKVEGRISNLRREERAELSKAGKADDLQAKLLREMIETIKTTSRQGIREDRKGVEQQVSDLRKGRMDDASVEKRARVKIQGDILASEAKGKRGGIFGGAFAGSALGTMVGQSLSRLGQIGGGMAQAETGESALAQMVGGLSATPLIGAAFGFLSPAMQRHFQERERQKRATLGFRAITGSGDSFGFSQFGFDVSETMGLAGQIARGRGFKGDIQGDTRQMIAAQKAFGIDQGMLMNISKLSSFGGGNGNILDILNTTLQSLPGVRMTRGKGGKVTGISGDVSGLNNQLEAITALMQDQSGTLESIDANSAAQILSSFKNIGGSFADARAPGRIVNLQRAISNPSNTYERAINFSTLMQLKPNASTYELLEMEERGLAEPGFMSKLLGNYESMYGSGDYGMLAAKGRFKLSASQGRTLWEGYLNNPTVFDNITNESDLKSQLGLGALPKNVSDIEISRAKISDSFSEGMKKGLSEVGTQMGKSISKELIESGGPMGKLAGEAILSMLKGELPKLIKDSSYIDKDGNSTSGITPALQAIIDAGNENIITEKPE